MARTVGVATIRLRNREFINELRSSTPCTDCGQKYHFSMMQFDHITPGTKRGTSKYGGVLWMGKQGYSIKNIQAEIDKCEVVCANCHQYRTWARHHKLIK